MRLVLSYGITRLRMHVLMGKSLEGPLNLSLLPLTSALASCCFPVALQPQTMYLRPVLPGRGGAREKRGGGYICIHNCVQSETVNVSKVSNRSV